VNDGTSQYRYDKGKFYTQDAETKEWNMEAKVENGSYLAQISNALAQITGGDENSFGSKYLSLFANDDINGDIKENALAGPNAGINGTTGITVYTSFSQNVSVVKATGFQKTSFYETLFHELAHAVANNKFDGSRIKGGLG